MSRPGRPGRAFVCAAPSRAALRPPRPGPARLGPPRPRRAPARFGPCRGLSLPLSLSAPLLPSRPLVLFLSVPLFLRLSLCHSLYLRSCHFSCLCVSVSLFLPFSVSVSASCPCLYLCSESTKLLFSGRLVGHINEAKALRRPAIDKVVHFCSVQGLPIRLPQGKGLGALSLSVFLLLPG